MANARACVARVSPALGESFDHLVDNSLYDISASEAKARNSYTAEMAAYNDGCVFVNPNTEVADCAAIVHEFGHFNHMYRVRANSFMPNTVVDVQEIMSQGLELLCYDITTCFALGMATRFENTCCSTSWLRCARGLP